MIRIFPRKGHGMNQTQRIRAFPPITAIIMLMVAVLALTAAGCGGNSPGSAAGDMVQLLSERKFSDAYDSSLPTLLFTHRSAAMTSSHR